MSDSDYPVTTHGRSRPRCSASRCSSKAASRPGRTDAVTRAQLTAVSLIATLSVIAGTTTACTKSSPPSPRPPVPDHDHFYDPPKNLASLHPGAVIRTRTVPIAGLDQSKLATAEQVLFVSPDIHDKNIAASETVLTPTADWVGVGDRPLLGVNPTYDSLGTECEPSYTLRGGGNAVNATLRTFNKLLPTGAEMVIPDYEGPDALFGIGDQQGRIALDGITAVESTGAGGIDKQTKVATWGYS